MGCGEWRGGIGKSHILDLMSGGINKLAEGKVARGSRGGLLGDRRGAGGGGTGGYV